MQELEVYLDKDKKQGKFVQMGPMKNGSQGLKNTLEKWHSAACEELPFSIVPSSARWSFLLFLVGLKNIYIFCTLESKNKKQLCICYAFVPIHM